MNFLICPWHNKKINYLFELVHENIRIKPNVDYAVKISDTYLNVQYRNDPKYYDKKPYKFLDYED